MYYENFSPVHRARGRPEVSRAWAGPGRNRNGPGPKARTIFFGLMSRPELTLTKVVRDHFHIEKTRPLLHFQLQVRPPNLIVKKLIF
jgi:hypothetical protein